MQKIRPTEKQKKNLIHDTNINRGLGSLQTDSANRILLQLLGTTNSDAIAILGKVLPPSSIDFLATDQSQARIQKLIVDESTEAGILEQRPLLSLGGRRRRCRGKVGADAECLANEQARVGLSKGLRGRFRRIFQLHCFQCRNSRSNCGDKCGARMNIEREWEYERNLANYI